MGVHIPAELRCRGPFGVYVLFSGHVRSASANGVGLTILGPVRTALRRNELVALRLELDGVPVELSAQVAWFERPSPYDDMVDLGLELHLEVAPAAMRGIYRQWFARLGSLPSG